MAKVGGVIKFELEGMDELIKILEALGERASGVLMEATLEGAKEIVDLTNQLAPGPNIVMEAQPTGSNQVTVEFGPDKKHWFYQFAETGAAAHEIKASAEDILAAEGIDEVFGNIQNPVEHPGMAARPFMRPAIDVRKEAAFAAIGERIRREIEKDAK